MTSLAVSTDGSNRVASSVRKESCAVVSKASMVVARVKLIWSVDVYVPPGLRGGGEGGVCGGAGGGDWPGGDGDGGGEGEGGGGEGEGGGGEGEGGDGEGGGGGGGGDEGGEGLQGMRR